MPLRFELIESASSKLWNYGWFDRSRFKVEGPEAERRDWRAVLDAFLLDPLSRRSYCKRPDPWGSGNDHHGPYARGRPRAESYRELSAAELRERVRGILDDPEFTCPPSSEQRGVIEDWLEDHAGRRDVASLLEEPLAPDALWEPAVWLLFHEFACFSAERAELSIVVIGMD